MLKCSNKNNNAKSKLTTGSCYNYTATKMRRSMLKCSNKKNNTKSKFKTGSGYSYTKAYIEKEMLNYVLEIVASEMFKI